MIAVGERPGGRGRRRTAPSSRSAGSGWRCSARPARIARLQVGESARLATSLVVREDSLTLYGFADDDERQLFELLQTANGVGPRLAQAVLAIHPPREVRRAVVDGRPQGAHPGARHRQEGRRAAGPGAARPARLTTSDTSLDGPAPAGLRPVTPVAPWRDQLTAGAGRARLDRQGGRRGGRPSSRRSPTSRSRPTGGGRGRRPAAAGPPAAGPGMSAPFDRSLTGEVERARSAATARRARRRPATRSGSSSRRCGRTRWPTSSASRRSPGSWTLVLEGAKRRGRPPDHVLLSGPPGLGKTSLALIIGSELGTVGEDHQRPGDRALRRPRRDAVQPRARRRAVHRRDPPDRPAGRGAAVHGDGGLPGRRRRRQGARARPRSRWRSTRSPWSAPPPGPGC